MVFGIQKLQDQIFCLQEERDYFQTKYLEQVSEIQALKEELAKSKKEITRLRQELMDTAVNHVNLSHKQEHQENETKQGEREGDGTASCLTEDEEEEEAEYEEGAPKTPLVKQKSTLYEEDVELRQSAEKLLQWASYRSSVSRSGSAGYNSSSTGDRSPFRQEQEEKKVDDNDQEHETATSAILENPSDLTFDDDDDDDDDGAQEEGHDIDVPPSPISVQ